MIRAVETPDGTHGRTAWSPTNFSALHFLPWLSCHQFGAGSVLGQHKFPFCVGRYKFQSNNGLDPRERFGIGNSTWLTRGAVSHIIKAEERSLRRNDLEDPTWLRRGEPGQNNKQQQGREEEIYHKSKVLWLIYCVSLRS